jgi:hypothetical protein
MIPVGVPLGQRRWRKEAEVRKAVSVAAFLTLAEIFDQAIPCLGATQRDLAYPLLETEGLSLLKKSAPIVNTNTAAEAVTYLLAQAQKPNTVGRTTNATITYLHSRRNDGMNSRGDLSQDGLCYSDYTLYQAVNPSLSEIGCTDVRRSSPILLFCFLMTHLSHSNLLLHTQCSAINYLDKHRDLKVSTSTGESRVRSLPAPYMARVTPFTDETSTLWQKLDAPPEVNNPEFTKQHGVVLNISSRLDDRDKIVAEFWADGSGSSLTPGHWHDIALEESDVRNLSADDTLHLLFLQANAVFDASIASWT